MSKRVPEAGLEPAQWVSHYRILSPTRLPIPPLGQFIQKGTEDKDLSKKEQ